MGWAFFCPLRWAEQRLGRPPTPPRGLWTSLCLERCLLPFPVLSPALPPGPSLLLWAFPASESGGGKGANVFSKASCCLSISPPLGSWERLGGGQHPGATPHPSPGPGILRLECPGQW